MVITMYIGINGYKGITALEYASVTMNFPVIVVYINMDGDTYLTISWHMKMPGNKHQKNLKAKLHS